MDINEVLKNFQLPEYVPVGYYDVFADIQKTIFFHPEMEVPKGEQFNVWKNDLAVERFINSIIKKVELETGINYNNI